jgi:endonuclease VIII
VPEGDTIWYAARRLHEALAGRVLTRTDFRVPRFAATDLAGQSVIEAVPRGKHLLIRTDGGLTIHTHLKMEGFWRIRPATPGAGRRGGADSYKIRLLLANAEWEAAGYLLGIAEVLPTAREHRVTGHLGPDLLHPDWNEDMLAEAVRRLTRDASRPIGEALLDQANLAGIGNFYLTEMLFLRGISPWRGVGEVEDLDALVELGRRLLDANKARIDQVTTGDTRPGRHAWVYRRPGQPCRRCGTRIRKGEQGAAGMERVRFWCPACQK